MAKITKYKPGSEVLWELRSTFWPKSNPTKFSIIAYVYAERWLSTSYFSEIVTKVRANDIALDANNKKFKMDVGLLADLDETELRSKTLKGCPNILFKHTPAR